MKKLLYLFIITGLYSASASALTERSILNFTSELGTPITTITTATLAKGSWDLSQRTEYYQLHPLSDAALLTSTNIESQKIFLYNYLLLSYGLKKDLTIGASLPYLGTYQSRGTQNIQEAPYIAIRNLGTITGLSDTSFYGLWRIIHEDDGTKLRVSIMFGLSAPTGKTNVRMSTGELFSTTDQPGTGAWNPLVGLILSKKIGLLTISSNLFYTQTTKGSQETTLGSYFDYDIAVVYPLFQQTPDKGIIASIDAVLEINGEYRVRDKIAGISDPDSGYNSISISPGFRMNLSHNISCYIALGFPIAEVDYGTQSHSNYSAYSGIDFSF